MEYVKGHDGTLFIRLSLRLFPVLKGYAHLVVTKEALFLVDTGSGLPESNHDLLAGMKAAGDLLGRSITLADVDAILITHGHIDHFGGLPFIRQHTRAPVYVHELDVRVLSRFEERTALATRDLAIFLQRAGVREERRRQLMEMYGFARTFYRSVSVDGILHEGETIAGFDILHVPGHCPGHVCLRRGNVMLVGDHVLPHTSPHLSPESITRYTGLGHYFESLARLEPFAAGVEVTLGGHEGVISDVIARAREIRARHLEKLQEVLEICREPRTIVDISLARYDRRRGYEVLLALTETGAHVEYLYERGYLKVANLEDVEADPSAPVLYQSVERPRTFVL